MPTFDFVGWAFTSLSKFDFLNQPLDNLIVPLIIIALSIYLTLWLFSTLHRIKEWRNQIIIVIALMTIVLLSNLVYLLDFGGFRHNFPEPAIIISWYIINNFIFWAGAIILPTFFIYPEIREQNLRRIVALCFFLTGIFRYGSEYLISFTPASGLSYVFHEYGYVYAEYNLVMVPVTVGFAFLSYWILHELMLRVPFIRRWLHAE